jgi:hypothetical protein
MMSLSSLEKTIPRALLATRSTAQIGTQSPRKKGSCLRMRARMYIIRDAKKANTEKTTDTVVSTTPAVLSVASPVASGSAVPAAIRLPHTLSIIWSERDTRKYNCIPVALWETRFSNATTAVPKMSSSSVLFQPSQTPWWFSCAGSLVPPCHHRRT